MGRAPRRSRGRRDTQAALLGVASSKRLLGTRREKVVFSFGDTEEG